MYMCVLSLSSPLSSSTSICPSPSSPFFFPLLHFELHTELDNLIAMQNLHNSANKGSDDAYDVHTSLTLEALCSIKQVCPATSCWQSVVMSQARPTVSFTLPGQRDSLGSCFPSFRHHYLVDRAPSPRIFVHTLPGTAWRFALPLLLLPSGWLCAQIRAFDNYLFFTCVGKCACVQTAPKFVLLPCAFSCAKFNTRASFRSTPVNAQM